MGSADVFVHILVCVSNVQRFSLTSLARKDFQSYPFLVLPLPKRGTESLTRWRNSGDVMILGHPARYCRRLSFSSR